MRTILVRRAERLGCVRQRPLPALVEFAPTRAVIGRYALGGGVSPPCSATLAGWAITRTATSCTAGRALVEADVEAAESRSALHARACTRTRSSTSSAAG